MTENRRLPIVLRLLIMIGAVGALLSACQHYGPGPHGHNRGPAYRDGNVNNSPNRSNRNRMNQNRTNQNRSNRGRTNQTRSNRGRTNQGRTNQGRTNNNRQRQTRNRQNRPVHSKARTRSYREYQDKN